MSQRAPRPAVIRRLVRALVLVGGAVVWWLLFSGGAAHADGAEVGGQEHSVTASAQQDALDPAVHALTDTVRRLPGTVDDTVDRATKQSPEPVRTTVVDVTIVVDPVLSGTATSVADVAEEALRTGHQAVDELVTAVPATSTPATRTSSVAESRPGHQAPRRQWSTSASAVAAVPGHTPTESVATDAPETPDPGQGDAPVSPVLPGGSVSAPFAPGAELLTLALLAPPVVRRRRTTPDAGAPRGPAYQPGTSPD